MKITPIVLMLLIMILQWALWFGKDGVIDLWEARKVVEYVQKQSETLTQRNNALKAEVLDLQNGLEAVEERARSELGLVKQNETFIQIVK